MKILFMSRCLLVLFITITSLSALQSQCGDGRLKEESWSKISNEHRSNIAFSYGMVSYQSLEDNYYYDTYNKPEFYLGYGKGIWVSAITEDQELRVSANSFPDLNRHDFLPGPLDRNTGLPLDTVCAAYNRVWKVTGFDIFQHRLNFEMGNIALENIPSDILEWPAKGNPYLNELSPDFDLAPFVDVAEDGIYDPLTGDYPIALEESPEFIPHEFSFVVYNDRSLQTQTSGNSIGIELQQMNYIVTCNMESEAEKTVFTRIKYKYLGEEPLAELKISLWEDNDLGCNLNDYEGCDRALNCTYFYNRNGETFVGLCHDDDVPDNNGAIRTTVFLNETMLGYRHWYLLGVGDPIVQGIDPSGDQEYYNYMSGLWRDGMPLTKGGNGYNPGSTDTVSFSFPNRPRDSNGWSMQSAQLSIPLDVRALTNLVSKPMASGGEGYLDFADHLLYDKENKRLEVFDVWPQKIEQLKLDHENMINGSFDCGGGYELCVDDCVWPGDTNRDRGVTGKDFVVCGVMAGIGDEGNPRQIVSTEWFGFNAENWNTSLNNTNFKHGDVNGSGTINLTDLENIEQNLGQTRAGFWDRSVLLDSIAEDGLTLSFPIDSLSADGAQIFERILKTSVRLGSPSGSLSQAIHGISFDLRFDTNMVAPFVKLDDNISQVFQYNFSGFTDGFRVSNELKGDNRIQYAFTNYNGTNISAGGLLVEQNFYLKEDARTNNLDGRDTLVMKFYNVCALNSNGESIAMGALTDTLILTDLIIDSDVISTTAEAVLDNGFIVYPNPTSDETRVVFQTPTSGQLSVVDVNGRLIHNETLYQQTELRLSLEAYNSGIYFISLLQEGQITNHETLIVTKP